MIVESDPAVIVARLAALRVVVLRATVAAVLIVASEVALSVVVPVRFVVTALTVREPEPFNGEMLMLPVVEPPSVSVLFRRPWIVPSPPRVTPFPEFAPAVADTEAVGFVPAAIPRTENLADVVAVEPTNRSTVWFAGNRAPFA